MSCSNPLLATRNKDGSMQILSRDKWSIADAERYFGRDNVFFLPCGKCSSCRLAKRKEYAVRCAMEAKYYERTCFITLTYDDQHLKGWLCKKDLTYFIKKLRNKGLKVRYFGCGEYGSRGRPHYHIVIFGYFPKDAKYFTKSPSGVAMFRSEEVDKLWNKGLAIVQDFDPACAGYVAGYVTKKIDDKDSFLVMSKKPGLGYKYMLKHIADFKDYDLVCDDFGSIKKAKSPRYFDKICDSLGIDISMIKQKRLEAIAVAQAGEMLQFGLDREAILRKKGEVSDKKERKLIRKL